VLHQATKAILQVIDDLELLRLEERLCKEGNTVGVITFHDIHNGLLPATVPDSLPVDRICGEGKADTVRRIGEEDRRECCGNWGLEEQPSLNKASVPKEVEEEQEVACQHGEAKGWPSIG